VNPSPQICIVGAGAVGLVYASYLRRAGSEVALLVKPEHAETCARGFSLHQLKWGGRIVDEQIAPLKIHTSPAEVTKNRWDQIWLTVASDAMRAPWLGELLGDSGEATVAMLQPDLDDRSLVLEHIPEERLVHGLIGFLSFQAPLLDAPAPTLPEGIAYTLLPIAASRFDGARAPEIVSLLRRGGFRAGLARDLPGSSAERSATTVPLIAGLEVAGWSIADFVRGPWLAPSIDASKEALAAVAARLGRRPAVVRHALHPISVRAALTAAPHLTPFDLEAYLRFHFTKVGAQTRLMLETYARHAAEHALPGGALEDLRAAL